MDPIQEIQALREALQKEAAAASTAREALRKAVEQRTAAWSQLDMVERFLKDTHIPLDIPEGCTAGGNVPSLAFRAHCTINRLHKELTELTRKT